MLIAPQPTADVPEEVIDQALATDIRAIFLPTGLLAPVMAKRGSGAIVNVGSINGLRDGGTLRCTARRRRQSTR